MDQESFSQQMNFPKNVGIIFLERPSNYVKRFQENKKIFKSKRKGTVGSLDFDQVASAHLFLQMNYVQRIFQFQVIRPFFLEKTYFQERFPYKDPISKEDKDILDWFYDEITSKLDGTVANINYWIGITSQNVGQNWFFRVRKVPKDKGKMLSVITSEYWEKLLSPPSLFEYIALSIFICSLQSLNFDRTSGWPDHERTKGCIFDFTRFKYDRRILVSKPGLCQTCRTKLKQLEENIAQQDRDQVKIIDDIERVILKKWMGSLKKVDSPIYNLNKNYKYNVDRNSGFYKTRLESILDNIKNNSTIWIVTGLTSMFFVLLGTFLTTILRLEP